MIPAVVATSSDAFGVWRCDEALSPEYVEFLRKLGFAPGVPWYQVANKEDVERLRNLGHWVVEIGKPVEPPAVKPRNLAELADAAEVKSSKATMAVKLLRLMHRNQKVTFAEIMKEVHGALIADVMNTIKAARKLILEYDTVPYWLEVEGNTLIRAKRRVN
jgi:hypothetical protein